MLFLLELWVLPEKKLIQSDITPGLEASYRLLEKDRYTEFLDAKYEVIEDEDKNLINPNIIAQAVVRAVKPYDRYLNVFDENALKNFK